MAEPHINAAQLDSLAELVVRAEDMGYHHAARLKPHFRSWATVDLLYRLIATLAATEPPEEVADGKDS